VTWRERLDGLWTPARQWYARHGERDRRIIAAVAVAAAFSLLYVGLVVPLRDRRQRVEQEIDQGLTRIEHAERLVASRERLEAERVELRHRLKVARQRLLPGGSETLGAAALQERANALASAHGVTVRTTQVLRSEAAEPYRKVSVRLTLSGSLEGIAAMLGGLEYQHQLLIPFLELSSRGGVARAGQPSDISATIEVAGFVSGKEEAASDADLGDEQAGPSGPAGTGTDELVGPPRPPTTVQESAT
jgi:type II secretory pathway component PulM